MLSAHKIYSVVNPRAVHDVFFTAQGWDLLSSLALLLPVYCHHTDSRVWKWEPCGCWRWWALLLRYANIWRRYLGRKVGWPSEVYQTVHVNRDMFEVKLKISLLLLILFPGLQESREPRRTKTLFLRRLGDYLGFLHPWLVARSTPKLLNTQVHGIQAFRNKRTCNLPYWIILDM